MSNCSTSQHFCGEPLKRKRVYLSGGMEYARGEGANWRNELQSWIKINLHHTVFNPNEESNKFLRRRLPGVDFRKLKSKNTQRFIQTIKKIVSIDSREIATRTDYVVCLWDSSAQKGAGTKGELTLAKYFRKPVYMVTRMQHKNIPGWVLGCTTKIFFSFSTLKQFLQQHYSSREDANA